MLTIALLAFLPVLVGTGCTKADGLCDNGFLPDPNNPAFNISSWTHGFTAGWFQLDITAADTAQP